MDDLIKLAARERFFRLIEDGNARRAEIARKKGKAYSGQEDPFSNFKRNAERLGLTKYQVWSIYAAKHIDSIFNAIKSNPQSPRDESEGLQGRVDDCIVYLNLLLGMLSEDGLIEDRKSANVYGTSNLPM